jgi:hypothetical protein
MTSGVYSGKHGRGTPDMSALSLEYYDDSPMENRLSCMRAAGSQAAGERLGAFPHGECRLQIEKPRDIGKRDVSKSSRLDVSLKCADSRLEVRERVGVIRSAHLSSEDEEPAAR